MSYSRFPLYVWSDGYRMHLWVQKAAPADQCEMQAEPDDYEIQGGLNIDHELFDQLCLARVAYMAEADPRYLRRIGRKLLQRKSPFHANAAALTWLRSFGRDPRAEFKTLVGASAGRARTGAITGASTTTQWPETP